MLLNSSDAESDRLRAYVEGANSYLVTPVAAEAFVDLEELSRHWMQLNRPA